MLPRIPERPRSERLVNATRALQRILRPTPLLALEEAGMRLFAKLEYYNPVGSLKDRTAFWILKRAIERGDITESTTLIESSSGNFASALAAFSRMLGLTFVPVIDPNITGAYESFLRTTCATVVKVTERDDTGGFLKTRLAKVQELCAANPDSFWTNQYGNPDGMDAHYQLTGPELCQELPQLDYAFVGVSTGGTISGLSRRLKEHFPKVRIVAVDAKGSVIFGGPPGKRHIPGIGASVRPALVDRALIDDVVMVSEKDTAAGCHALLDRHGVFAGGSSGTLYSAILSYAPRMVAPEGSALPTVAFLCADRGTAYLETVYDPAWAARLEA